VRNNKFLPTAEKNLAQVNKHEPGNKGLLLGAGWRQREGLRVRSVCALAAHCEVFWPLTGGLFLSLALSRALDTCALGKRVGGVCDPACTYTLYLHATGKCQGAIIGGGCGDRRTTESIRRRQPTEFPSKNSCTEVLSPHSMHSSAP